MAELTDKPRYEWIAEQMAENGMYSQAEEVRKIGRELLSLREAARREQWQPIETAPRDETRILLVHAGYQCCIGHFDLEWNKWQTVDAEDYSDDDQFEERMRDTEYSPTHWKPLPPLPQPASEKAG